VSFVVVVRKALKSEWQPSIIHCGTTFPALLLFLKYHTVPATIATNARHCTDDDADDGADAEALLGGGKRGSGMLKSPVKTACKMLGRGSKPWPSTNVKVCV